MTVVQVSTGCSPITRNVFMHSRTIADILGVSLKREPHVRQGLPNDASTPLAAVSNAVFVTL